MSFGNSLICFLMECRLRDPEGLYIHKRSLCGRLGLLRQMKQVIGLSVGDLTQAEEIAFEKVSSLLSERVGFCLLGRRAAGGISTSLVEHFWVIQRREGVPSSVSILQSLHLSQQFDAHILSHASYLVSLAQC